MSSLLGLLLNALLISWKLRPFRLFEEKTELLCYFVGEIYFTGQLFFSPLTSLPFHGTDLQLTFRLADYSTFVL